MVGVGVGTRGRIWCSSLTTALVFEKEWFWHGTVSSYHGRIALTEVGIPSQLSGWLSSQTFLMKPNGRIGGSLFEKALKPPY